MKITTFLTVNNGNLVPLLIWAMALKFALFTKGSKLPLNKDFKNMFELLQSQPLKCCLIWSAMLTFMGTRKPVDRHLLTRPDYPLWEHNQNAWHYQNAWHLKNMQILDQTSFKIFHLHVNNQTPWRFCKWDSIYPVRVNALVRGNRPCNSY